jgi:hypothetical protein
MRKKTDPRLSDTRRIKSSGNAFVDLGAKYCATVHAEGNVTPIKSAAA